MKYQTQQLHDFESQQTSFQKTDKLAQAMPFFEKYANPNDIQSISELHGFLAAAVCIPIFSTVDQWLEFIFEGEILWETEKDKTDFSTLLSDLHSEIKQEFEKGDNTMAVPLDETGEPIVKDWCSGFCRGTHLWDGLTQAESLAIQTRFAPIATFGDPAFHLPDRNHPKIKRARNSILETVYDIYTGLRAKKLGRKK